MSKNALHNGYLSLLHGLWGHTSRRRRFQFLLVLVLTIIASFSEMLTIGAVFPFVTSLISPEKLFEFDWLKPVISYFNIKSTHDMVLVLTSGFCLLAIFAGLLRVSLLWASNQLSCRIGTDLSIDIYKRTLYQPYSVHINRNSSTLISGLTVKSNSVVSGVLNPILVLISSLMMLTAILISLLIIDYMVALYAMGIFSVIYISIIKFTKKRLKANSAVVTSELTYAVKALQEGLGGIRDVLIDGTQETYCKTYQSADYKMRRAQANTLFIGQCPRYLIEAFGTMLIALIACQLVLGERGLDGALPVLGALALGAQRMLPIIQQAFSSWATISGNYGNLKDTLDLLNQPLPEKHHSPATETLSFERTIKLNKISFKYNEESNETVIKQISLDIPKGARYGFIGETGSGKSTLLDILMGLLEPTSGSLEIDGVVIKKQNQRGWQSLIAHVPQTIFLTDTSVAENIAFGVPKTGIDMKKVMQAAKQAQIADLIEGWPKKYETVVGERGVKLSGGQRQRIGIARALYKNAQVIVFDEATSALDTKTESAVMQAVQHLGQHVTLIMIAHRLSTLSLCDKIIELKNGAIHRTGSYDEIVNG
jgi:ATP-binding cassette, subfamily B, bacterial PglK